MNRILVIEDDIYLREELLHTFEMRGYSALSISSFDSPEREIIEANPDLVVLDLNLPGKSGFELCKWMKEQTMFPVLILTARDALADELRALGLGADEYLTKPCQPDRLAARVERLLQTYRRMSHLLQVGAFLLDTDSYKLVWKNQHIILPETEGRILEALMKQYPDFMTKQELVERIWGGEHFVDENILQVNLTRLRKSLGAFGLSHCIKNIRGKGYTLEVE